MNEYLEAKKRYEKAKRDAETAALMCPGNNLKAQVRDLSETLSAFKVMNEAFFAN